MFLFLFSREIKGIEKHQFFLYSVEKGDTVNIKNVQLKDIKPYEKNARNNKNAVEKVTQSIKEFGFKVPIVLDKDNVIVCGHTRYEAAKKLKMAAVPCVIADDLTENQIKAYRLADNKVAEFSTWDFDILKDELFAIDDIDMSDFGFDLEFGDDEEQEVQEDDYITEIPKEPKAKRGDIYQLGRHRLMCGDSTNIADVKKLTGNAKIELLLTDPPYNMGYSGVGIIKETTKNVRERIKDIIDFDAHSISYLSSMDIGSIYIFTSKDLIPEYLRIFEKWKFNILAWIKTNNPPMCNNNFLPDIEYILYFHKSKGRVWNNGLRPLDIYRKAYFSSRTEGHEEAGNVHPTMKPLKILVDKIKISSNKNGNVLDLFGGSGSTMIACEQTDRCCYMMEYDPKYIDVIIDRWEQFTGEKAILLNEER